MEYKIKLPIKGNLKIIENWKTVLRALAGVRKVVVLSLPITSYDPGYVI